MQLPSTTAFSGIAVLFLLLGLPLPACGPSWWRPQFAPLNGRDWPEPEFAAGHLGVLDASNTRDEFIAYRILAGVPFTPAEIRAFINPPATEGPDWLQQWGRIQAVDDSGGDEDGWGRSAPGIYQTYTSGYFSVYLNCPEDAFRNAVRTYQDRSQLYSGKPQLLAEWLAAQHDVFANCSSGAAQQIPDPLPADRPAVARADRAYQIAAAHLYAGHYTVAARDFLAIASDKTSPWSPSGHYLAARAMVRQATVQPDQPAQANPAGAELATWLTRAEQQVAVVLGDPGERAWWPAARELSDIIEVRLHPAQRARELARRLMRPDDRALRQDEIDLEYVLRGAASVPGGLASNDLLAWVSGWGSGAGYAYARWRATHTLPWLVMALQSVPGPGQAPQSQGVAALLAAAARVPASSPAFEAVRYQRLRIQIQQGQSARAAVEIGAMDRRGMPAATQNRYRALAFRAAQNLQEVATSAPRMAVNDDWVDLDEDGLAFYNDYASLAQWRRTAALGALPPRLQDEFVHAGWTRAVLLDDGDAAAAFGAQLAGSEPSLAGDLRRYAQAPNPAEQHFWAAWLLLHRPGMSPWLGNRVVFGQRSPAWDEWDDQDHDNWWLPSGAAYVQPGVPPFWQGGRDMPWLYGQSFALPAFLAGAGRPALSQDYARLAALGPAPDLLTRWVLDFLKTNPPRARDRRDEALALAVRATVDGCGGKQTPAWSQAAYDLLRQDAGSAWAQRAPPPYQGGRGDKFSACD